MTMFRSLLACLKLQRPRACDRMRDLVDLELTLSKPDAMVIFILTFEILFLFLLLNVESSALKSIPQYSFELRGQGRRLRIYLVPARGVRRTLTMRPCMLPRL